MACLSEQQLVSVNSGSVAVCWETGLVCGMLTGGGSVMVCVAGRWQ